MRVLLVLFGVVTLGACAGDGSESAEPLIYETAETVTMPPTSAVAETAAPKGEAPAASAESPAAPVALAMSDPVVLDSHDVDLSDMSVRATVYSITADPGTEWELPLQIPVPNGWTFDSDVFGFTDGSSSIVLTTGCSEDCGLTNWNTALSSDGGFLAVAQEELGTFGFGSGSFGEQGTASVYTDNDDGTGAAATAIFNVNSGRYLGCTVSATSSSSITLDGLREMCGEVVVDWTIAIASTPVREFPEVLTASAAAIVADPAPGMKRQTIQLDEDDPAYSVEIALPAEATVDDSFFGTTVDLGEGFSIFSELSLDSNCDGMCGAQDWAEKLDGTSGLLGASRLSLDIDNDSPIESGWLLTGQSANGYNIFVVRWDDEASKYFTCSVELENRDVENSDAALSYCLSARPSWIS